MKKLIMAVAIVCAAVCAQAATTEWKITAALMKGADGQSYGSGTLSLYAWGGDLAGETLVTTFTAVNGSVSGKEFTSELFTAGTAYNFKYVLTDDYDSKDWTLVSETKSGTALGTGAQNLNWGNQSAYTNPSYGHWSAVPEPTSGLLMLIGLAGLALRRRRA